MAAFAKDFAEFKRQQQEIREREARRRELERTTGRDLRASDDVAAECGETLEQYLTAKGSNAPAVSSTRRNRIGPNR